MSTYFRKGKKVKEKDSEKVFGIPLLRLSVDARRERRALLGISLLGIIIVKFGANISKISPFGIEFTQINQQLLLIIIFLINLYFMCVYLIYAVEDFLSWKSDNLYRIKYLSEKYNKLLTLPDNEKKELLYKAKNDKERSLESLKAIEEHSSIEESYDRHEWWINKLNVIRFYAIDILLPILISIYVLIYEIKKALSVIR